MTLDISSKAFNYIRVWLNDIVGREVSDMELIHFLTIGEFKSLQEVA